MRFGLVELLEVITGINEDAPQAGIGPCRAGIGAGTSVGVGGQGELFGGPDNSAGYSTGYNDADIAVISGMHSETGIDFSTLRPEILDLFELSADAFGAVVYAWMSELPVTEKTVRFGKKIYAASKITAGDTGPARRDTAKRAATDRGDPDVLAVRESAYKVWHEIHRLMGLLRFCPDEKGVYTARCEPDHFVLPALGPHFLKRFGETPWVIIDNSRRLKIGGASGRTGASGKTPVFSAWTGNPASFGKGREWENLWKHYHKTVNNEGRKNPALQKRFMPSRYRKYLTEFEDGL